MNKFKLLVVSMLIFSLALTGCSADSREKAENKSAKKISQETEDTNLKASLTDLDIEITGYRVLGPKEAENKSEDESIIIFEYSVTNKSEKELTPFVSWAATIEVEQDNNKDVVNKLKSTFIDLKSFGDSTVVIKKGGTAKAAEAYTLTDATTPVKVTIKKGIFGEVLASKEYKITK